ncbi:hypothetical protein B0H21DRAFT_676451, partial [Amylocystis lapponica]
ILSKNVSQINPLRPGCFLVMRNASRMYIGELLDLYKKTSGRHGSVKSAVSCSGLSYLSLRVYLPLTTDGGASSAAAAAAADIVDVSDGDDDPLSEQRFSCRSQSSDIYTHASAQDLLYNLGTDALAGKPDSMLLSAFSASQWRALSKPKVQSVVKLTIKIP